MAPRPTFRLYKPVRCYGAIFFWRLPRTAYPILVATVKHGFSRKQIGGNVLTFVFVVMAASPCGPSPSCLLKGDFNLRVAPSTPGFQVHSVLSTCGKLWANNAVLYSTGDRLIVQGNTYPVLIAHLDRRETRGLVLQRHVYLTM